MRRIFDDLVILVSNYHSFISTFLEAGCLELSEMVTNPELEVRLTSEIFRFFNLLLFEMKKTLFDVTIEHILSILISYHLAVSHMYLLSLRGIFVLSFFYCLDESSSVNWHYIDKLSSSEIYRM